MSEVTHDKIIATLDAISERLDAIQDHMAWMITADKRFRVGQRVEWSRKGRRCGFPRRKVAQRGTVTAINGFSIVVKLEGLKRHGSFHHGFFNHVNGPKLF